MQIAKKTNADNKQIAKLSKVGLFSALFFMIVSLIACATPSAKKPAAQDKEQPKTQGQQAQAAPQGDADDDPMPVIRPKRPPKTDVSAPGPWEGYPAGTKYATVSVQDF